MNASSLPASARRGIDARLLQPNLRLRVGEHVVDVGALRVVTRPEHPRLTGKSVAVLIELVRQAGDTVTRDALLDRVWADRVTTPDVLTQAIKELRRAFGDDTRPSRYIETVPKVGYRLLAAVSLLDAEPVSVTEAKPAGNDPDIVAAVAPSAPAPRRAGEIPAWVWPAAAVAIAVATMLLLRPVVQHAAAGGGWTARGVEVVTSDPGSERRPAVSPDGTRIAYARFDRASGIGGVDRIVLRAPGESLSVRLTARSDRFEEGPAWSPDGSRIAFERLAQDYCMMYVVSSLGGAEQQVGPCRNSIVNYFDWTPDGKALITAEPAGGAGMVLERWDLATGVKQPLQYARSPDDQDLEAHYSPDGRYLAFRRGLAPFSDLCLMSAAGGAVRQLTQLHSRIRGFSWTPDSRGLVFASNHDGRFTLYTVDIDGGKVRALGVGPAEYPNAARHSDLVAYEIPRTRNRLAWVALGVDKAVPELLAQSTGSDDSPALSPDGQQIAFLSDRNGSQQLWLYDFATLAAMALTDFHDALLVNPNWRADGRRVLVTVRGGAQPGLVEIDLATRRQRVISKPGQDVLSGTYGPDPDSYLLVLGGASRQNRLVLLEHAGRPDERQRPLATGIEHMELDTAGRRVYYTRNAQRGLFERDLAGSDEHFVTDRVEASLMNGWRVVDGRIWYVSRIDWKPTDILEFDPATGQQRVLGHLQTELLDVAFSATPKRDRVVIVPLGSQDTDVGAFHLAEQQR